MIAGMKPFRTALIAALFAAAPLHAQEDTPAEDMPAEDMGEGLSLMEQGARMILRGLMSEMDPLLQEMEPAFRDLARMIGDITAYHAPEVLPNGDIILRRKTPRDPQTEDAPEPGGEIEL